MTKSFSTSFIISALIGFLLGLIMVIWPEASRLVICYGVGALLLLYGLVRIFAQWNATGFLSLGSGSLAGLLYLLLGLLLLLKTDVMLALFGTVLGLLIIADSIIKLQISYQLRGSHIGSFRRNGICALVMLVLGIVMLFNPFSGIKAMTIFIGVIFMLDGIVDFIIALDVRRYLNDRVTTID